MHIYLRILACIYWLACVGYIHGELEKKLMKSVTVLIRGLRRLAGLADVLATEDHIHAVYAP
jgi:hypothetical protein